jgi:hypothetical protein
MLDASCWELAKLTFRHCRRKADSMLTGAEGPVPWTLGRTYWSPCSLSVEQETGLQRPQDPPTAHSRKWGLAPVAGSPRGEAPSPSCIPGAPLLLMQRTCTKCMKAQQRTKGRTRHCTHWRSQSARVVRAPRPERSPMQRGAGRGGL